MNNMNPEFKIREVAERIKATRESVGLTPEEMAEKIGVSVFEYSAKSVDLQKGVGLL